MSLNCDLCNMMSTHTGGLLLAVYTTSIWPMMLDCLSTCPPVRTLLLAAFVWLVETLFSVWTVAYNFVPGGEYTREHTGWLIAAVMVTLGLATLLGSLCFHVVLCHYSFTIQDSTIKLL